MELAANLAKLFFVQTEEPNELEDFPSSPIKKDFLPSALPPLSPDNPPWNSWAAFGVWLMSVVFIVVIPNFFVLPYLVRQGLDWSDKKALSDFIQTDPTTILLGVIGVIPAHILTLALAWAVVTRLKKFSFREMLGWRWNGFSVWNCLIIVGGFYVLAAAFSYFIPEQDNELLRILRSSRAAVYIVAFLATFTAPLVEEVIYRGILYSAFQRTIGVTGAVVLVTVLFAGVHVPQYWGSPSTILLICILSLVLTLIRVRTKNLLPCIALHTVFNGTQSLLLILQPFIEKYIENHQTQDAALVHFFK